MKKIIAATTIATISALTVGILIGAGSVGQKPISLIVNGMTNEQFPLHRLPAPQIVDGYVMVPAASLKRTFREDVKWNSAARSIEINPDVWKEGGFGYKAEDWTKVRNRIYKYLIAVEEQDRNQSDYVSDGFQSNYIWDGVSIMDIQFRDGKENETTYTVRVATVLYTSKPERLYYTIMDFSIDKKSLRINRISSAPGGSGYLREYTVLPGIEIMTPIEG
ncbi:hypothetical protein [Paenibacillus sp. BC26]|uniref:hypothetical protein n=1 Tax=Paenibacillus sp. BC26 TaxID=1881032 RepID=UPI0008F0CEFB|nr:hypothetical protein [Paenibacillus sp. BC26]SFS72648.1 Copper amine oxidase N-terminal domain-containing protein [Paenibacillus sp. BC26]